MLVNILTYSDSTYNEMDVNIMLVKPLKVRHASILIYLDLPEHLNS